MCEAESRQSEPGATRKDIVCIQDLIQSCAETKSYCSKRCFQQEAIEAEDWEKRKSDGEISEIVRRMEKCTGERRCREVKDEDFQCRGKAVKQSAGFDGSDDEEEEEERKHNPY